MPRFTVDTHVFRELGELLVGRDSTALIELIKNSYDADATEVVVYGSDVQDTEQGVIVITDDGVGMDSRIFTDGFLRIASRAKDTGDRRSTRFKRRFTGAKGIGRLAAHKLARVIEVESIFSQGRSVTGVSARIDWDRIEQKETLDQIETSDAIKLEEIRPGSQAKPGTRITLRRLRRKWTKAEHARFLEEVQTFSVPEMLTAPLPTSVIGKQLLFTRPRVRDTQMDAQFTVSLDGDLAPPDDYWPAVLEAANWILEIDALSKVGKVRYCIAPTKRALEEFPDMEPRYYQIPYPGDGKGPKFQARILLRTGQSRGDAKVRAWSGKSSGIRIYMEGFRVLPYGDSSNDWLSLDRDATERSDSSGESESQALEAEIPLAPEDRPGLLNLPNKHYFGAIFLTQKNAPFLQMLVNREGFIPDAQYDQLVQVVRTGIALTTRVRAVASASTRQERREQRAKITREVALPDQPSFAAVINQAQQSLSAARRLTGAGDAKSAAKLLDEGMASLNQVVSASADIADQAAMLRVLASVGTQLSSFVHEMNGLLGMAENIESALGRLIEHSPELKREVRSQLREIQKSVGDLRRHTERQASYLVDVVSVDARRRRSRQKLHTRFESAARLVQTAADRREIEIRNGIPPDLRSPPMFAAELTTVFANLLSNAIKAAGNKGRIKASGQQKSKGTSIRVENTGKAVNLRTAERWFRPFESSTAEIDPILGQGMGLGLTITRTMLDEYGATIEFVKPSHGFSTALEITFNG